MIKLTTRVICISVPIVIFAAGCSIPQVAPAMSIVGTWQVPTRGVTNSLHFTTKKKWEYYRQESGVRVPVYRGTYRQSGTSIDMQITHGWNSAKKDWDKKAVHIGPNISGRIKHKVNIEAPALAGADFVKIV